MMEERGWHCLFPRIVRELQCSDKYGVTDRIHRVYSSVHVAKVLFLLNHRDRAIVSKHLRYPVAYPLDVGRK